jgi:hypothetical protein
MNGATHIASRIIDGLASNRALLTGTKEVPGVADGFAMDAWLANWDVVGLSYDNLLVKAGRAIRVDTGGALRYRAQGGLKGDAFGKTVPELDSLRDGTAAQTSAVFGNLTREQMAASARKVLAFSDADIDDLVARYGPTKKADRTALAATLKARRDAIGEAFPEAMAARPAPAPVPTERVTRLEAENINNARSNGYALPTDKGDVEDQQVLVWHKVNQQGDTVTSAYMKIRGDAEGRLRKELGGATQALADYNDLNDKVLGAIKSIRYRIAQGEAQLTGAGLKKAEVAVERYHEVLRAMEKEVADGLRPAAQVKSLKVTFEPYMRPIIESVATAKPVWDDSLRTFKGKKILAAKAPPAEKGQRAWRRENGHYTLADIRKGRQIDIDDVYRVNTQRFVWEEDGVRVEFYPDQPGTLHALKGRLQVTVPGNDPGAAARVFAVMDELGIDSSRATEADMELLYLRQIAYANKIDTQPAIKKALDAGDADQAARLISSEVGVDIRATGHYKPTGERQAFEHGRLQRFRPELLGHPDWPAFDKQYVLYHRFTNGDMVGTLERIIEGGGQMAPTTDKMRRGIPMGGMSPEEDLATGGANYFFTRINTKNTARKKAGITWKARMATRIDAITYDSDNFGRTTGDFVRQNRLHTLDSMKQASRRNGNETILKDSVSIFDNIDHITVDSESQRQRLISFMKKAGYDTWPGDGRALDDVIRTKG